MHKVTVTYSGICKPNVWTLLKNLPLDVQNGVALPCPYSRQELREIILGIQAKAQYAQEVGEMPRCDIAEVFPLRHIFAPGAYAREMTLPAGHWIIGKIHKHAHLNFITKGKVAVLTEEGPMLISAPFTFVSTVGTKRLVLVLEETIWTTVHVTDKTDLEEIEKDVIAKSYDELEMIEWKGGV